jgi:hypothetical protein
LTLGLGTALPSVDASGSGNTCGEDLGGGGGGMEEEGLGFVLPSASAIEASGVSAASGWAGGGGDEGLGGGGGGMEEEEEELGFRGGGGGGGMVGFMAAGEVEKESEDRETGTRWRWWGWTAAGYNQGGGVRRRSGKTDVEEEGSRTAAIFTVG